MDKTKLNFFTVEEMTTPKEGYVCYLNRHWCLSEDSRIICYKTYSWQCNPNEKIAKQISKKLYSGNTIFLPIAYVPNEFMETYNQPCYPSCYQP